MSPSRHAATGLAILLLALAGSPQGSRCAAQVTPKTPLRLAEVDPVAAWLPESTVAHLMISGAACLAGYEDLAITEIFRDEAVQEFLRPVRQLAVPFLRVWADQVCEGSGVTFEDLMALGSSRLTVSFLGMERSGGNGEGEESTGFSVSIVGTLHFGPHRETMARLLDYAEITFEESDVGTVHRHEIAGESVHSLRLLNPSDSEEFWYLVKEDTLIVATTKKGLTEVLNRRASGQPGLATHPPFASVTQQVLRPRSAFFAYLDTSALLDMMAAALDENLRALLAGMGLDAFEALGYGCDLDGRGLRDRIYAHSTKKRGLIASFQAPRGDIRSHHLVPADCGVYLSGAYNLVGTYDWINAFYERSAPFEAEKMREAIGQFESRLGFSLRDDLLAGLGPEYAVIASFPRRAVVPDIGLMVQVRDRAKIEAILQDVVSGFGDDTAAGRFEWMGETVSWVGLDAPGIRPTWTFVDDFILISPWPQGVKRFLAGRAKKTPRLADAPDFRALLAHLRKDNPKSGRAGISYLDFEALVGFLADNGTPLLQTLTDISPSLPIDFARLPETERITRHLFGVIGASHWEDYGGYSEFYSPTGLVLPYMGVASAAAAFLMASPTQIGGLDMGSGDIEFADEESNASPAAPVKTEAKKPAAPTSRPKTPAVVEDG